MSGTSRILLGKGKGGGLPGSAFVENRKEERGEKILCREQKNFPEDKKSLYRTAFTGIRKRV